MEKLNPADAFKIINKVPPNYDEMGKALDWVKYAPARDLQEFLLLCISTRDTFESTVYMGKWAEFAKLSLQVRISADATLSSDALLAHTKKLTHQTDDMIKESRQIRFLTWGLIGLTVGLLIFTAGLLWIDWHKESSKPNGKVALSASASNNLKQ